MNLPRPVLVLGFGPFLDVLDNPAAALARAVDGAALGASQDVPIVGRVMPVSYQRSLQETLAAVAELDPCVVVGIGVAVGRTDVCVERVGRMVPGVGRPDVDGRLWAADDLGRDAPPQVLASLDVVGLASAMGAVSSDDAGAYVCNAWLYQAAHALEDRCPVGFVHVPAEGMPVERLLQGLAHVVASLRSAG